MDGIEHEDRPIEVWRPGVRTRMQVSRLTGATALCIFEQWMDPGAGAPTHTHTVEEVLTVLAGEADMWIEEAHVALSAGRSLIVPAGRPHGFRNVGPGTLHVRAVLASPVFEATFDGPVGFVRRWA